MAIGDGANLMSIFDSDSKVCPNCWGTMYDSPVGRTLCPNCDDLDMFPQFPGLRFDPDADDFKGLFVYDEKTCATCSVQVTKVCNICVEIEREAGGDDNSRFCSCWESR